MDGGFDLFSFLVRGVFFFFFFLFLYFLHFFFSFLLRLEGAASGGKAHGLQLVVLFPLHPAVLEPDLDLALGEAERVRDLDAPPPREVPVEVELLLQLERLVARVSRPRPFPVRARHI